jgi:autotransporter-associated beta strand protein
MNVNICMPVFVTRVVAAAVTVLALTGAAGAAEWITDANGNWNDDANWANPATFPNGADSVADFSLLDITAARTIALGQNISVGTMTIGDASGGTGYIFSSTGQTLTFNQTNGASLSILRNNATFFGNAGTLTLGANLTVENEGSGTLSFRGQRFTFNNNTLTNSGAGSGVVEFRSNVTGYTFNLGTGTGTKIVQDSTSSELHMVRGSNGWASGLNNQGVIEVRRGTFRYGADRADILGDSTDPMTIKLGNGGSDAASYVMAATVTGAFFQPFELVSGGSGALTIAADDVTGTLTYTFRGGVTGDNSLTIENRAGNESLVFNTGSLNFSGVLTHSGAGSGTATINSVIGTDVTGVTQDSGTSRLILGGANTYAGPTSVTAGTLALGASGSISSSSAISVGSGATFDVSAVTGGFSLGSAQTLGGSGTVAGAVSLTSTGSTLSPGASPGILSFDTAQTWDAFSYEWEVNDWTGTTAGTAFDQIAITGSLDLSSGTAYQLDLLSLDAGNASGQVPNFAETARSWTILTTTTGITGFNASLWTIDPSGFSSSPTATGTFSLATGNGGQDLVLSYVPVPEPAALGLLGVAGLCAGFGLARQRRRAGFPFGQ